MPLSSTRMSWPWVGGLSLHDRYLGLFCVSLAGYATMGKGFAQLGAPPLYVGEIILALGLVVLARTGCWIAMLASLPSIILSAIVGLVAYMVATDFPTHGIDAVRDGVIVLYGLFAFVVIGILLENPERLEWVLAAYSRFVWLYPFIAIPALMAPDYANLIPTVPGADTPIVYLRLGEGASHLAGVAVFGLLGLRRVSRLWVLMLPCCTALIMVSRGAMLALLIPIAVAALLGGRLTRLVPILSIICAVFVGAYVFGLSITLQDGRSIGPQQVIDNVASITGVGGVSGGTNLSETKAWRLFWWDTITGYTIRGDHFWTGKGFGVNLAVDDGFSTPETATLRAPHSAHMSMLARAGVPGLLLWITLLVTVLGTLLWNMFVARTHNDNRWADLFLFFACYILAIVIDASFDVALEGPMLGIWFWTLVGFGIGSTMIYRAQRTIALGHLSLQHLSPRTAYAHGGSP